MAERLDTRAMRTHLPSAAGAGGHRHAAVAGIGTAVALNVDLLPRSGDPTATLRRELAAAGPDVRVAFAIVSSPEAEAHYAKAAATLRLVLERPRGDTSTADLVSTRAANWRQGGKYANVAVRPAAQAPRKAKRLLLVDLENIGMMGRRASRERLNRLVAAAGPVAGVLAVSAQPLPPPFVAACAKRQFELVLVNPGPDAADAELVSRAGKRAKQLGCDGYVVASCDHYFRRLQLPFDVVVPEGAAVSRELRQAATSVRTVRL